MGGVWGSVWSGILLPSSVLQSQFFAILAGFVAVNTLMYVTLAIAKMLPRIYVSDLLRRRDRRRAPPRHRPRRGAADPARLIRQSAPVRSARVDRARPAAAVVGSALPSVRP